MVLGFEGRFYKRLVKKGPWWFWSVGRGSSKRPLVKKGPWWFWSVGRGVLQEAPGQKRPLIVLGFGGRSSKGPWSKGPLVVLEARARPLLKKGPWWFSGLKGGSTKGWSKRAPGGFGA